MTSDPKVWIIIGAAVATLFFLAAGVNQVMAFFNTLKEKPAPANTYQTLAACKSQHEALDHRLAKHECAADAIRSEFGTLVKELNRDNEKRAVDLHNRINPLGNQVSAVDAEVKLLNQRTALMDSKMDNVLVLLAAGGKSKHS